MAETLNVREEIASAPLGAFHLRLAALLTLVMIFDGYDLFNAAYVIPLVRSQWHPSPTMIGMMLSSGIVGLSIGAILQGLLADRYGRRRVMLTALWTLTAGSLLLGTVADDPLSFAGLRVVLGVALGMITPLVLTCINEWAPRARANVYSAWVFQFGFAIGGICAGIAGIYLTPAYGWRSLYYVGSFSVVVAVVATLWFPESIQYLALHERDDDVRDKLARLWPARAEFYRRATFGALQPATRTGSLPALLAPIYRRNTIVIWLVGFLGLFCIHGLTGWLPSIVVARGEGITSAFAYGTLVMAASIFGGVAMGWLADRLASRTRTMAIAYLAAALSMGGLGVFLGTSTSASVTLVAATGFFLFGAQAVMNNYQAMSYRTELRSTGVGTAQGLNRVGGILGPFLVGLVASIDPDPTWTFVLFAGALVLAAAIVCAGGAEIAVARPEEESTRPDPSRDALAT
jgi:MFS family permease